MSRIKPALCIFAFFIGVLITAYIGYLNEMNLLVKAHFMHLKQEEITTPKLVSQDSISIYKIDNLRHLPDSLPVSLSAAMTEHEGVVYGQGSRFYYKRLLPSDTIIIGAYSLIPTGFYFATHRWLWISAALVMLCTIFLLYKMLLSPKRALFRLCQTVLTGQEITQDMTIPKSLQNQTMAYNRAYHNRKQSTVSSGDVDLGFLSQLGHSLRTPLNVIIGFAELLKGQMLGKVDARYVEYADAIFYSGTNLLHSVDNVLDYMKAEFGLLEAQSGVIEVQELIEEVVKDLQSKIADQDLVVKTAFAKDLPYLEVDPHLLRKVITNIISNAINFTLPGGVIHVSVYVDIVRKPLWQYNQSDNHTVEQSQITPEYAVREFYISIRDTGVGISKEQIQRSLHQKNCKEDELLSRTKDDKQGIGLGLRMAHILTQLQEGAITIESDSGRGTVVVLRFPEKLMVPLSLIEQQEKHAESVA